LALPDDTVEAWRTNNRTWQLEKRAKDLAEGLEVFPPKTHPTKTALENAFVASGNAIEAFVTDLAVGAP